MPSSGRSPSSVDDLHWADEPSPRLLACRRLLLRRGSLDVVLRGSIRSDGGAAIVRAMRLTVTAPA